MQRVLRSALAVALVTASHVAWANQKPATQKVDLNIDEATLTNALLQFTRQSNLQMVFATESAGQFPAPKLVGTYTPQKALDTLLKGSGLEYAFINDRTVSIRLAQHEGQAPSARAPAPSASEGRIVELDEVVVTGSWIRGNTNIGANMLAFDRAYIGKSGYATAHDFIRTLPQDFNGGASEDDNVANAFNANRGVAVNLRGLGVDSTLVLVNGRRQSGGGLSGSFIDVSSLAPGAIDRIEVLADGASAIYGSDAVGGVVNFILRKDFQGAESSVRVGTLDGDSTEYNASQLFGTNWSGGNAMVSYQYYRRDALKRTDRSYTASDDMRRFGGSDFRRFNSNPGTILTNTNLPAYAIPAGQDGTALTPASFVPNTVNYQTSTDRADVLPQQELHSGFFNVSQDLGDHLTISGEGRLATREMMYQQFGVPQTLVVPSTNAFYVNPFGTGTSVRVAYDFIDDLGPISIHSTTDTYDGALRAVYKIAGNWQASLTGSHNAEKTRHLQNNLVNNTALTAALRDSNRATAFNPFGDGSNTNPTTLAGLRALQVQRAQTTSTEGNLIVDGPLFQLPAGAPKLAVGVDHRHETLTTHSTITGGATTQSDSDRTVTSTFAELAVPVLEKLQLSLAARYDDYSDVGHSVNPRYGLSWQPVQALTVRGTVGKSFKAPRLFDLLDSPTASVSNQASIGTVSDPKSPTGTSRLLRVFGGNANLKPETATTWTAGLDLTPVQVPDLALSLTYFDIDYRNRIAAAGPSAVILVQESIWAPVITRNPTREQVDKICNSPLFVGDCTALPNAIADLRLTNLSRIHQRGVDAAFSQVVPTSIGDLQLGLNATYTLRYDRAVSATAPEQNLINTYGNPLKLRMRGLLGWNWRGLTASSFVNHGGAYEDTTVLTGRRVPSLTTVDLQLAYETGTGQGWLDDMKLELSAINLFDKTPPFFNIQSVGYDAANADLYGRILSVQLAKSW